MDADVGDDGSTNMEDADVDPVEVDLPLEERDDDVRKVAVGK